MIWTRAVVRAAFGLRATCTDPPLLALADTNDALSVPGTFFAAVKRANGLLLAGIASPSIEALAHPSLAVAFFVALPILTWARCVTSAVVSEVAVLALAAWWGQAVFFQNCRVHT